jgi:transcriptional regulator GlxA family with amidase domain
MDATIQVLIFIFPVMDTLDFAAPLETLTIPNRLGVSDDKIFNITIAAVAPYCTTSQGVVMKRHISIDAAMERLKDFDILVAPGGRRTVVQELAVPGRTEFDLVKAFVELSPKKLGLERIVLSICTGAFFLAAAGCLKGMQATTAKGAVDALREYVPSNDGTKIISARYVC